MKNYELTTEEIKEFFYIKCIGGAKLAMDGEFLVLCNEAHNYTLYEYSDELTMTLDAEGLLLL